MQKLHWTYGVDDVNGMNSLPVPDLPFSIIDDPHHKATGSGLR
jgi:hypothetical protein